MADDSQLWHLHGGTDSSIIQTDVMRNLFVRGLNDVRRLTTGEKLGAANADISSYSPISASIKCRAFGELIRRTMFVISETATDSYSDGALLILQPQLIAMIATDGHRLSIVHMSHGLTGIDKEIRRFLHRSSIATLSDLISHSGHHENIELLITSDSIGFRHGGALHKCIITPVVFPRFEKYLHLGGYRSFIISADEFKNCLCSLVGDIGHFFSLNLTLVENTLYIWARDSIAPADTKAKFELASERMKIDWTFERLELCLDVQYVLDFLETVDTGAHLKIAVRDIESAIQLTAIEASPSIGYRHLIAPKPSREQ